MSRVSTTPKTIQIYLPSGDPQGIRVAEITTRIVQVIEVPRSLLPQFLKMTESDQVALYFLVAGSSDGVEQKVYIGQTGDLRARLSSHHKEKDFWERALVLISKTNSLTQTHALFLEWYCLQTIRTAGRFSDENSTAGSRPHTPAPLEADCVEIFDTGRTLLTSLGHPLFDAVRNSSEQVGDAQEFFLTGSSANGRGVYTEEGFVVLKGSIGKKEIAASKKGTGDEQLRLRLVASGVMRDEGDHLVFVKDHLFRTPSGAGVALMGRAANGWVEWKTKDGKTLKEVKRS